MAREIVLRSLFHIWDENYPDALPEDGEDREVYFGEPGIATPPITA